MHPECSQPIQAHITVSNSNERFKAAGFSYRHLNHVHVHCLLIQHQKWEVNKHNACTIQYLSAAVYLCGCKSVCVYGNQADKRKLR